LVDDVWWTTWDQLNDQCLDGHPLLTSVMARLLCTHFGNADLIGAQLRTGEAVHAQAIVSPDGRGKWSIFNPSQAPIGLLVFRPSGDDYLEHFRRLIAQMPGVSLALSFDVQDPSYSAVVRPSSHVDRSIWGTTVSVDCSSSFQSYWDGRPKDLKHNLRRYFKRLKEQYGENWSLVRHDSPAAVIAAVDRYGELEGRGWKGREGTALQPDNVQGRFYRSLLEAYAAGGNALVYELYFGDTLAAARLLVSGPTMYVILKTTYDEELARFAPGRLLLYLLLERTFEDAQRRPVEFYTRANSDTLAWSTHQRDIESVTLYRNTLAAALAFMKRRYAAYRVGKRSSLETAAEPGS
jgi:hypothetical protein